MGAYFTCMSFSQIFLNDPPYVISCRGSELQRKQLVSFQKKFFWEGGRRGDESIHFFDLSTSKVDYCNYLHAVSIFLSLY